MSSVRAAGAGKTPSKVPQLSLKPASSPSKQSVGRPAITNKWQLVEVSDDTKDEESSPDVPADEKKLMVAKLGTLIRGFGTMKIGPMPIAGALNTVNFVAGVATLAAAWDPTGITDWRNFATLFAEYRVTKFVIDVTVPLITTVSDWIGMAIVCDDPASQIGSFTPGTMADAYNSRKLQAGHTTRHVANAKRAKLGISSSGGFENPTTDGGWLPCNGTSSGYNQWPGRSLVYVTTINASSTNAGFYYQPIYMVEFRMRST